MNVYLCFVNGTVELVLGTSELAASWLEAARKLNISNELYWEEFPVEYKWLFMRNCHEAQVE